jgi:hypothetical protein
LLEKQPESAKARHITCIIRSMAGIGATEKVLLAI